MKNDAFYALTTLCFQEHSSRRTERTRTVGIFNNLGEAKTILLKNIGDLNEAGWYPYAVIEELPMNCLYPQIIAHKEKLSRHWFQFDHELNTWRAIDDPAEVPILPYATIG